MRIGVIGCGTIASAALGGIAQDGHQITVSERSARHANSFAEAYENVSIAENQGVVDASDVTFLGLMAEVALRVRVRENFGQVVMALMSLPRARHHSLGDLNHIVLEPLLRERIATAYPGAQQVTP